MSRNVSMQFGRSGGVVQNRPGWKFIRGGEVTDDTTEVLSFAPGGLYILVVKVWNASTGAYRGHALYFIAAPEEDVFGTVAIARATGATGGTISLTLTNNSDSTLSIKQSSATYNFRYALYRVDGAGGGTQEQSTIPAYTGAYSVDPSFETQTLATANKRMTADVDVNAIEVASVSNPQGGNTVYIAGIIEEE